MFKLVALRARRCTRIHQHSVGIVPADLVGLGAARNWLTGLGGEVVAGQQLDSLLSNDGGEQDVCAEWLDYLYAGREGVIRGTGKDVDVLGADANGDLASVEWSEGGRSGEQLAAECYADVAV